MVPGSSAFGLVRDDTRERAAVLPSPSTVTPGKRKRDPGPIRFQSGNYDTLAEPRTPVSPPRKR